MPPVPRYMAICHTLEFMLTARTARLIILAIWLVAGIIMTPWAIYYQQVDFSSPLQTIYICQQLWPSQHLEKGYFLGAIFLTCYTIPLVFISVFYTLISCRVWNRNVPGASSSSQVIHKSKVKVLKMMIVVVILFAFSWLPIYAVTVRRYFGPDLKETSLEFHMLTQIVMHVAQWLGASNSCVNPIIYCFFSNKFRKGFKDLCVQCCRSGGGYPYSNRNNSALYRSVNDNGHTVYTSVRGIPSNSSHAVSPVGRKSKDNSQTTFV